MTDHNNIDLSKIDGIFPIKIKGIERDELSPKFDEMIQLVTEPIGTLMGGLKNMDENHKMTLEIVKKDNGVKATLLWEDELVGSATLEIRNGIEKTICSSISAIFGDLIAFHLITQKKLNEVTQKAGLPSFKEFLKNVESPPINFSPKGGGDA